MEEKTDLSREEFILKKKIDLPRGVK